MPNPAEAPEVINAFLRVLVAGLLVWNAPRFWAYTGKLTGDGLWATRILASLAVCLYFASWCSPACAPVRDHHKSHFTDEPTYTPGRDLYLVYRALLGEGE